jgi:filamentous hemagglutinin family protein
MFLKLTGKNIVLLTGLLSWIALPSAAQVTPDNSTSTTVTNNGAQTTIEQGDRAGDNLFHSFRDFSVPNGGEAFFNNAADIVNIFSRVTGGNISNIDGLLRANGGANLFLINPAGIIFGDGASLDIGGSFYGSSADSILFEDGEFSATDLENPPLLTINAPIGLSLRDNPGEIAVEGASLEVNSGQSLTLVGGNLRLQDGARLLGFGGRVQLAGLNGGVVNFDENLNLSFPADITLADLTLSDNSVVNVTSSNGGSIEVNVNNLDLTQNSALNAGIGQNSGSSDAQAGDIIVNASGNINLDNNSSIFNQVGNNGQGNSGNVVITANSLTLNNRSFVGGGLSGTGNSGDITFNVANSIRVDGASSLRSLVERNAVGNSGNITIDTGILRVSDENSLIFANTRGVGDAGDVTINATDSVTLIDNATLISQVEPSATGNSGNVSITTPILEVRDFAGIFTTTAGTGNGGNITINTRDRTFVDRRSSISAGTTNQGNAGNIAVNTNSLTLNNFALLSANTRDNGNGTAGNIVVNANDVNLSQGAIIGSFTETNFTGGTISLNANSLNLSTGGKILTSSDGLGNAGDINLNISNRINIDGSNPAEFPSDFEPFQDDILERLEAETGLFASTTDRASGDGGNINIDTDSLNISNDALISASSLGSGNGGVINITGRESNLDRRSGISASTASGQGGEISLNLSENLRLSNNSRISAQAFNEADGGNIIIDAQFVVGFPSGDNGNDIVASAEEGDGGNINITTESIFGWEEREATPGNETNDIDASSDFGFDGEVLINTPDVDATQGVVELSTNVVEPRDVTSTVCSNNSPNNNNSLTVNGKGGLLPAPTEELTVDNIAIDSKLSQETETPDSQLESTEYPPILTAQGPIYPARGVIVKPNGDFILTGYPTSNVDRVVSGSKNCPGNE